MIVSALQVAESIKRNVVLAIAFIKLVRGDPESVMWCTLVWPVVSKTTGQNSVAAQYA